MPIMRRPARCRDCGSASLAWWGDGGDREQWRCQVCGALALDVPVVCWEGGAPALRECADCGRGLCAARHTEFDGAPPADRRVLCAACDELVRQGWQA